MAASGMARLVETQFQFILLEAVIPKRGVLQPREGSPYLRLVGDPSFRLKTAALRACPELVEGMTPNYQRGLRLNVGHTRRAGIRKMLLIPGNRSIRRVDLVFDLGQAMSFARIAKKNRLDAYVFEGNE
jgi:hypothetical protein